MTKQELKAKIDKLENGIKSKATPSNLIAPLKAQKAKLEKELQELETAEKKAVKTKKVSKVAEKIKAAKTSVAKKTPAKAPAKEERKKDNIARDGDRKSLPAGKRISKSGKIYYETRANRSDKQTSKKPYLAKGGTLNNPKFLEYYQVLDRWAHYRLTIEKGKEYYLPTESTIEKILANDIMFNDGKVDKSTHDKMNTLLVQQLKDLKMNAYPDYADGGKLPNGKYKYEKGDEGMFQGDEVRVVKYHNGDRTYEYNIIDEDGNVKTHGVAKAEKFENQFRYFPKMADGGEIDWGADLGGGFSVGNDVYITDSKSLFQGKTGFVSGSVGRDLLVTLMDNGNERSVVVSKKGVERLDAPEYAHGGYVIFEGRDNYNDKPLYKVISKDEDNDYDGEFHDKREDAEKELNELKNKDMNYAKGGNTDALKKIKDYYVGAFPTDDLGEDINADATFNGLSMVLNDKGDVYEYLGVADSLVRERVFDKLSKIEGVSYDVIYDKWLDYDYAKGGYMADGGSMDVVNAEIYTIRRNIMGTTSFMMKIKGMRNPQDFSVYPISADQAGQPITIQSDTRFGFLDLSSGRGLMSQSHANGAYRHHFTMDKKVPFKISETDLQRLKDHISGTAGSSVGNMGISSDNSGASMMADGGYMADGGELKSQNGKNYKEEFVGSNRWLEVDDEYSMTKSEHESEAFRANSIGDYELRDKHREISQKLSEEPIKMADGGEVKRVTDGDDTYYLTYIDSTHFYLSNSKDYKGNAFHIAEFRSRPFYDEVKSWLKSHKGEMMAKGGQVPAHFGSGKNIEVFGYETKNFDICGTAVKEFEAAVDIMKDSKELEKESLAYCAKYVDNLFGIEKVVVEGGIGGELNFSHAVSDIMSASTYNFRAGMAINLYSFVPQHLMEIALRLAKAEKGGLYALGGMTAGRWYKDKSGEEFKFIGKVDSGANKGRFLFSDGQKSVYKDLEEFEGGKPKETKLFGFFAEGGSVAEGNYEMLMSNIKAIKHHAEELAGAVKPDTEIEAWVLSKSERAETDLSDITHYLDGLKMEKGGYMADGGVLEGLSADIYRSQYDSPTNKLYGKKGVIIVDKEVPKIFDADESTPAVKLVRRKLPWGDYIHAIPYDQPEGRGMFGGTFIYSSDSRFPSKYPIPLHDRVEMEKGGYMAKGGELSSIKEEYLKNEDENAHSENVVLLAKHFGTKEDLAKAKEILALHEKEGSLSSENGKKRQELHLKLITKARAEMGKQGIEFEKGGYMAKGGEVRYKLAGNNFGQQIESGKKFAELIKKAHENQTSEHKYPENFIKEIAYTGKIVKNDGTYFLKDYSYKGVLDRFEFLGDKYFLESLKYLNRPTIKNFKFEDGGMMAKGGETNYTKKWKVVGITIQGKKFEKEITLGRMSDKNDVMNALKRMPDTQIREVTLIEEKMAKGGIYSSDSLYILKVSKDGKEVGEERFRAKNAREAREMGEDYEEKYKSKFGGDLSFSVKEAESKMADGGETEDERALKLLNKLKEEGKLKRYLDVRGNGKKVFDTIIPNKSEKGVYKRYESTSQSSIGTLQNEYLDESDVLSWLKKTMPKREMAMGGKTKFSDKVKAVQESLLKRKKVAPQVQKDYGKTYDKKEAKESAQRIVGSRMAQLKEKMAKKKK